MKQIDLGNFVETKIFNDKMLICKDDNFVIPITRLSKKTLSSHYTNDIVLKFDSDFYIQLLLRMCKRALKGRVRNILISKILNTKELKLKITKIDSTVNIKIK